MTCNIKIGMISLYNGVIDGHSGILFGIDRYRVEVWQSGWSMYNAVRFRLAVKEYQ